VVNLMATRAIGRANRTSLNVRGAYLHVLTDLYAFLATGVAGLVMVTTGFTRADAIATLIVVALMLRAGAVLVRECTMAFLEAAPAGVDPPALGGDLAHVPGVAEVHDLHVWQITSGQPALSAHVMVSGDRDCHTVRADIESLLRERYGIGHSTVQVDHEPAEHRCEAHGESYRSAAG
jgi:cobalt-zinc-cadmium efflux system protein